MIHVKAYNILLFFLFFSVRELCFFFFFSSRRRHTRLTCDWSSDVCSSDLPWRRYASELGVLFQIVDDILDVTGTDAALGKPHGTDERLGKRTYVTEFGLDGAKELAGECHRAARSTLADAAPHGATELEQITDFIYTRTS